MIPKSGHRFSEKIMLKRKHIQKITAPLEVGAPFSATAAREGEAAAAKVLRKASAVNHRNQGSRDARVAQVHSRGPDEAPLAPGEIDEKREHDIHRLGRPGRRQELLCTAQIGFQSPFHKANLLGSAMLVPQAAGSDSLIK